MSPEILQSLASFRSATDDARSSLSLELAERLGKDYQPTAASFGALRLLGVRHLETSTDFVAIPGGSFTMGFSDADLDELDEFVHPNDPERAAIVAEMQALCRPVHEVRVAPFLAAAKPVQHPLASRLIGALGIPGALPNYGPSQPGKVSLEPEEAAALMERVPFRYLSEAEYEYLARQGGHAHFPPGFEAAWRCEFSDGAYDAADWAGDFGLEALGTQEWVGDGWHEGYAGAPTDGSSFRLVRKPEVLRPLGSYPWQAEHEILLSHAAYRARYAPGAERSYGYLRCALTIPT